MCVPKYYIDIKYYDNLAVTKSILNMYSKPFTTSYSILIVFLSFIIRNANTILEIGPLLETKLGPVRGLKSTNGEYSMFMGIPYATVDKANPFGAAIVHPGFNQTFDAIDDTAMCPQLEEFNQTIVGSLDCLHINIYVPNTASSRNLLPILVWIYGGNFNFGFSGRYLYGPRYLVQHDIIFVTFNYRVGPYGFMCLDIPEFPGNQGLRDQELALAWIKNNIDSFGGDPNKITLAGSSSGAVSVDFHLIFNRKDYFNQVILHSGSAMCPWLIVDSDPLIPLKLAHHLGFSTGNVKEALDFLTTIEPKLLIAATIKLNITFKPCVEKAFANVKSFISEHTLNNIDVPRVKNMSILLGDSNNERAGILSNNNITISLNIFNKTLMEYYNFGAEELADMDRMVRHFYIGDENINELSLRSVIDFLSDTFYVYPVQQTIQKYLEVGAIMYQYIFSYHGKRNYAQRKFNINTSGAIHADELAYIFDISYMKDEPFPKDQTIINQMTKLWTNFVKYGNPTPEISKLLPVTWPPITREQSFYLNIGSELSLGRRPFHQRMAFWDIFYKLNYKFHKGY